MKDYKAYVISKEKQIELFGKPLSFYHGFVDEHDIDWWGILEDYLCVPVVSVREVNRAGWNEIIVLTAKGFVKNNLVFLDYCHEDELKSVLLDIFTEAPNDECEVFEQYRCCCNSTVWLNLTNWVRETFGKDDDDVNRVPITEIGLSARSYHCLYYGGIRTIGDLKNLNLTQLRRIRNVGEKTVDEITSLLQEKYGIVMRRKCDEQQELEI